ncbi:Digeranylgeranylglycerophospholipid reductase [uncultured archaeon]|nr:Digeranylgeranylglycerophospholipid reductase [uncultured archaeon]
MRYDAAVVGGGPAGSMAAKFMAKAGNAVVLVEEHKKDAQPVQCSGLISVSGMGRLGVKADDIVLNRIRGAKLVSPGGETAEIRPKKYKAFVYDRRTLDARMQDEAVDFGAVLINERAIDVTPKVTLPSGELAAEKIVLATGTNYRLPLQAGFRVPKNHLVGAQYEMKIECDLDMVELHFTVPRFFSWIIPKGDGTVRIGTATYQNPTPHLEAFISRLKREGRVKAGSIAEKTWGAIPIFEHRLPTQKGRFIMVGDCAGQVKATTGGGVIMGCQAATHANDPQYDKAWRADIEKELRLHLTVHRLMGRLPPKNMDRLIRILSEHATNLEEKGDMDLASKTISSLIKDPHLTFTALSNAPGFFLDLF